MSLPNDPVILLSYVNTMLRDKYASLTELCKAEGGDEAELKRKLALVNYEYDPALNKFI